MRGAYPERDLRDRRGYSSGNRKQAIAAFEELGEMAGDALASAITLIDGLIVIGGGLSGASKYILPALLKEMNAQTGMMDGARFGRLQRRCMTWTTRRASPVLPGRGCRGASPRYESQGRIRSL